MADNGMRLIAITPEVSGPDEIVRLLKLLRAGFSYVHIRKPSMSKDGVRSYISAIPQELHPRLKLHSHFELAGEFAVGGFHLNHRYPIIPAGIDASALSVSRSCHSLSELKAATECDYAFLSPVFDSISKTGYGSAFPPLELMRFFAENPQCHNAVALGGVTAEHLHELREWGFAGAAFLGYIFGAESDIEFENRLEFIKNNT
ncbi:MAG: thiamine phosphate synthase [Bacteroidales bacterium]|nr:thiamine phosphate synthase [Bacteroidales bacterium]